MSLYRGNNVYTSTTDQATVSEIQAFAQAAVNSADAAAVSETNAATSETNAAASAASAANTYDDFDDRYLGAKVSAPVTDNDGDALIAGALYFNTSDQSMYVYDGTEWSTLLATNTSVESITLTSGQTSVTFNGSILFAAFYLSGPDVDNGRLLESVDYTANVATRTITLTNSYPAGTVISSLKNASQSGETSSAESVTYNSSTPRTVADKLSETVSVKDFGAVCDGLTDDAANCQAAWDSSNPLAVLVPAGNLKVDSAVTGKFYSFGVVTVSGSGSITITNLVP